MDLLLGWITTQTNDLLSERLISGRQSYFPAWSRRRGGKETCALQDHGSH